MSMDGQVDIPIDATYCSNFNYFKPQTESYQQHLPFICGSPSTFKSYHDKSDQSPHGVHTISTRITVGCLPLRNIVLHKQITAKLPQGKTLSIFCLFRFCVNCVVVHVYFC